VDVVPRAVNMHALAIQPLDLEPTYSYGQPLRGAPEPLGATYDRETVRAAAHSLHVVI
jgi:hypothetical protein